MIDSPTYGSIEPGLCANIFSKKDLPQKIATVAFLTFCVIVAFAAGEKFKGSGAALAGASIGLLATAVLLNQLCKPKEGSKFSFLDSKAIKVALAATLAMVIIFGIVVGNGSISQKTFGALVISTVSVALVAIGINAYLKHRKEESEEPIPSSVAPLETPDEDDTPDAEELT